MGREQRGQVALRQHRSRPQVSLGGRVAAACALLLLPLAAAAQRTANPADFAGQTITAIELHLPTGASGDGLTDRVLVRRGQRLSMRAVRESIERLWGTERFADVVVLAEPHQGGVRLVFELAARRCIVALGAEVKAATRGEPPKLSDDEVIQASGLSAQTNEKSCPESAEYYPDRLKQAVEGIRAAYHARGYHQADAAIELYEQTRGMEVNFVVTEGPRTVIGGISVSGDPGFPLPRLLSAAGLRPGDPLDRGMLERATAQLREALRRERYWRARVGEPTVTRNGTVAEVALPVSAGPRFELVFSGNRSFTDRQLTAVLGYSGADALDQTVLARMEGRLRAFYRDTGFFDAQVTVRERTRPDGAVALLEFVIEEGPPLYVRELRFEGNVAVPSDQLREIVIGHVRGRAPVLAGEVPVLDDPMDLEGRTRSGRIQSPLLEAPNIYNEAAYRSAADAMSALYRDRGYLDAVVELSSAQIRTGDVEVEPDLPPGASGGAADPKARALQPGEAWVLFQVTEGPQTIVRELTVRNSPSDLNARALLERQLRTGQPLNYGRVEQAATALSRELNKRGYLFAKVSHVVSTGGEGSRLDGAIEYEIDPGPQVRMGEIDVIGLGLESRRGTDDALVRRIAHLKVPPGEILNAEALFDIQRELVLTGAFRQVGVRLVEPEVPATIKDIEVVVRESARYAGEVGGGFSLSEGPRVVVDARAPNVNGSGVNLNARGRLNYVGASAPFLFGCVSDDPLCVRAQNITGIDGLGGRGNVSLHQPRIFALLPAQVGLRADLVAERVHRPVYAFTRFAGIGGLEWTHELYSLLGLRMGQRNVVLNANLQYELEHDRVNVLPELERASLGGDTTVVSLNERFPEGNYTLHNALARVSLDLRDDATNPTQGGVVSFSTELTHGLLADLSVDDPRPGEPNSIPIDFRLLTLKTRANLSVYLPVPLLPNVVFAFSAQAGQIFKLSPDAYPDDPVLPKRFFLGGFNTLRGFREDAMVPQERRQELRREIDLCNTTLHENACPSEAAAVRGGREPISEGGQQFALAKLELRFPVVSAINLGLFFEAGNLWRDPQAPLELGFEDLRYVAGAGLRYGTPIGPLAFDFGFNLAPELRLNEQIFNFHFSIGLF